MSTEPATTEPDEPGRRGEGSPAAESAAENRPSAPGATPVDGDTAGAGSIADAGETAGGRNGEDETDGDADSSSSAGASDAGSPGGGTGDAADAGVVGPTAADGESAESAEAGGVEAAPDMSEAEAELAAQRAERERIERRKAEKKGPIASGAKLSGVAADLLAAVRAVEGGQKPAATVFSEPEPAPRRPAPEPVRRPQPVAPVAGVAAPSGETVEAVRAVLAAGGAPEALGPQVAEVLGEGAGDRLRADPWQLLRVPGVRPEQADGFARALLGAECGPDDERRGRAVTVWLLEQAAIAGHTALEAPALAAALAQRSVPDPDAAVQSAVAEGEALVFQDALDDAPPTAAGAGAEGDEAEQERPVRVLIGLERYALAEESLADGLARVVNSLPKEDSTDWPPAEASVPRSAVGLIRAVAGHGLVLHTGGEAARAEPAALITAARALGLRAYAATHSADGRRRFAALIGGDEGSDGAIVATVAGLLSGAEGPGRDADGALDLDLLVVLDAPQLDVETAAVLVESLPDGARLVLSGDPGVLWSAGPGRVFADLLAARTCPQVASRTPDPGPIGELVSGIGIGELNQVDAPGKEVVIVPVRDAGEAVHRTAQLVVDSVPRAFGIPAEQVQVITPGHGGAAGTRALNVALKERLNPGPGRFGGFDPGDRVVHSPVPGRTTPGRVVKADAEGLHLECAGAAVVVPKERVEQSVRHAWALTAHQAVGHRWPAVVVVLPGDAAPALSRPWVYTAFGRAERHLSVVHGVEQALPRAVAEIGAKPRTTRLPVLLKAQVPSAD
ncbi:helix-hairpin-helix domain-containing protein [Streptomyces ipomoeae]|uniref:helix-hairpin-helix domain-containing protein n=1 Tax=Streptomyces ipomoeae TaxID=103232 RepID=UPI00114730C0|nr:helix-hairpin-helix domain-containing protein [Streptomyces ipomoeae]MDX2932115.1 helix-hairpin-helix domain-containing protein [Streptomyces ipomoeae]TQE23322.1 DNA helicase RecD [Streptomyces ipomoeae]